MALEGIQVQTLKAKDGKEWEVRVRLAEIVAATEYVLFELDEEKHKELWEQVSSDEAGLPLWKILKATLKGKLGPFLTCFILPVGEDPVVRDIDAEWDEIRVSLGAFAMWKVLFAFLASSEASGFLVEANAMTEIVKKAMAENENIEPKPPES